MSTSGLLTRRRVVSLRQETTEGTWIDANSTFADFNVSAVSWRPIVNTTQSDNLSDTFTKATPRAAGVALGEITFTTELAGLSANSGFTAYDDIFSDALPIFRILECCGMTNAESAHYSLIGAVATSIYQDGENVTDGSYVAPAAGNTWNGVPRLWLSDDSSSGSYNSVQTTDTMTGAINNATSNVGADPPPGGSAGDDRQHNDRPWVRPISDPLFSAGNKSASIKVWHDGKEFSIRGARGTFTMECTFGGTVKFNFTFQGILQTDDTGDDGGSPLTQNLALQLAPVWTGVGLAAQTQGSTTAAQTLTHASLTLDYGNTLVAREDASDESGYSCTVITDRNTTLRLSPDETLNSGNIDWVTQLTNGQPFDLFASVNATSTTPGNRFDFKFHGAVPTELTPGDRDGVETNDLTFSLTAGDLPDGSESSDTEFMLFNW